MAFQGRRSYNMLVSDGLGRPSYKESVCLLKNVIALSHGIVYFEASAAYFEVSAVYFEVSARILMARGES